MVKLAFTLLQIILAASAVLTKSYGERMINCNVAGVEEGNVKNVTAWRGYISSTPMSLPAAEAECRVTVGPTARLGAIVLDEDWFEFCRLLRWYALGATFWTSGVYDPESSIWKWEINDLALPPFAPVFPSDPDSLMRVILYRKNEEEISLRPVLSTEHHGYICQLPP